MDLFAAQPLISFVLTGVVVTGSPGPATLAVMATGTAFGPRRSMPYLLGSTLGTIAVLVVVGAGLTSAVLAHPVLAPALLLFAVAYLTYLAWKIATAPPLTEDHDAVRVPTWVSGAVLASTNPKAYAGLATVLASSETHLFGSAPDRVTRIVVLAVLIVLAHLAWLAVGSSFAAALRRPVISRAVNVLMALALVVSTVPALLALVR